jgi:hypothetical protein
VSPDGSDSNPGTIDRPFATWEKLSSVLEAGDLAYIRGGTYRSTKSGSVKCLWSDLTGTANDRIRIWAYPGEHPILDLSDITPQGNVMAVAVRDSNYVWFKGLRVTGLSQTVDGSGISWGWSTSSSNIIHENIEVDHIGGYGFTTDGGKNNIYKNCDVHHCSDMYSYDYVGGGANGFGQTGNTDADNTTYVGCRSWWNSDDGWDLFDNAGSVTIENCWAFWNGFIPGTFENSADGIGFKLGGPNVMSSGSVVKITVTNSIAYQNKAWSFTENTGKFNMRIYNNIAYQNCYKGYETWGCGFHFNIDGVPYYIKNNIAYNTGTAADLGVLTNVNHNSWNGGVTVTDDDFISLDGSQLLRPRKSDGSLPDITFLHLASGSDLIDKGTNVGLSYSGSAPDLGAFETG